MLVRDIMSKNVLTLGPKDTVSKFIGLMEQHHVHEVPIVDGKKFLGIVHYKTIASKRFSDPSKEKLEPLITRIQALGEDNTFEEAADTIFQAGFRAVPVCSGGGVTGIISVFDLLNAFSKLREFKEAAAEGIMSVSEVIGIESDIGKARVLMREKNISRLPVVDAEGKLRGEVATFDLLKAVKPSERMSWYSMAAEKETIMGVQISAIMNDEPLTAEKQTRLSEIADMMVKYKNSGVVIVEDDAPVGVVTTRDLLEFYLSKMEKKGVYVQITGLGKEDPMIAATADRMLRDSLQKISSFLPVQFLFMHTKRYDKGGKTKYSVRCRLMTDRGIFISRAIGWDLRDAAGQALDELEKIIIRDKERKRDKVMRKIR
ncbi:MAG: CBS domain-containing protein, partial [Nanoarchaeota archaeon]|nr:CBS domain-containing protein [Nanoarchaeota archaeon]